MGTLLRGEFLQIRRQWNNMEASLQTFHSVEALIGDWCA